MSNPRLKDALDHVKSELESLLTNLDNQAIQVVIALAETLDKPPAAMPEPDHAACEKDQLELQRQLVQKANHITFLQEKLREAGLNTHLDSDLEAEMIPAFRGLFTDIQLVAEKVFEEASKAGLAARPGGWWKWMTEQQEKHRVMGGPSRIPQGSSTVMAPESLKLWTRAALAGLMFTHLLKPTFFGTDHSSGQMKGVDHALRDFENRLWFANQGLAPEESAVGGDDVQLQEMKPCAQPALLVDWRVKTVQLCQALVDGQQGTENTAECAKIMMEFVETLLPEGDQCKERGAIQEELERICANAFALRMKTRVASDVYEFVMPGTQVRKQPVGPLGKDVKVVAVDGGGPVPEGHPLEVACLLFGGLRRVRFVNGRPSAVILEQAQVVVVGAQQENA